MKYKKKKKRKGKRKIICIKIYSNKYFANVMKFNHSIATLFDLAICD